MGREAKRYWWVDEDGSEHGPMGIQALIQARARGELHSSTPVREGAGAAKPFHEHDLRAEIDRAGQGEVRRLLGVLGVALVSFAMLFVAIFASPPLSAVGLALFVAGATALAVVAGRHRQVGLSMTATLIPAAVGMMATIQQPLLLEPLGDIFCGEGETLISAATRTEDPTRWNDPMAVEVTMFWTACASNASSQPTYAPMFTHGLVLLLFLGAANRVGRYVLVVPE